MSFLFKQMCNLSLLLVAGLLLWQALPFQPGEDNRSLGSTVEAADTQSLEELDIGDKVVDESWEWEHRTARDYSRHQDLDNENKPVTWIVVAKNHYGEGGVTLLSEELIGRYAFDDSSHVHDRGYNHWGESGSDISTTYGLRPWLNEEFYGAFSDDFQDSVISTTIPNKEWEEGDSYTTEDKVFIPSTTELGDTEHNWSYEVGSVYPYFSGADDEDRLAELPGNFGVWRYWTRSPSSRWAHFIRYVISEGGFYYTGVSLGSAGVRPVVNLNSEVQVSTTPNAEGVYEIKEGASNSNNSPNNDARIGTQRLHGSDRFETALKISDAVYPEQANAAVLARGDKFPDALAGVPLAFQKGGPLLLTNPDSLHSDTEDKIDELLSIGDTIYILGGEAAISEDVANELEEKNYNVRRLEGANRYETAIAIAKELVDDPQEAFLATGQDFADAVAVSGVAAVRNAPVLLTHGENLSDSTSNYIEENNLNEINVIGGPAAVSEEVKEEAGGTERIYGDNRWVTAVEIAEEFVGTTTKAALATGDNFPDALSGGVYAAQNQAPVLLTTSTDLSNEVEKYLENKAEVNKVTIFGGEVAVSEDIKEALEKIE